MYSIEFSERDKRNLALSFTDEHPIIIYLIISFRPYQWTCLCLHSPTGVVVDMHQKIEDHSTQNFHPEMLHSYTGGICNVNERWGGGGGGRTH